MSSEIQLTSVYVTNALSLTLALTTIFSARRRLKEPSVENHTIGMLLLMTMIACVVDPLCSTVDGRPGAVSRLINYCGNLWLFTTNLIVAPLWLRFVRVHTGSEVSDLHRNILRALNGIGATALLLNFLIPVVFSVDANNVYHRGPFFWYFLTLEVSFILYTVLVYYKARRRGGLLKFFPMEVVVLPLLVGIFLQTVFYGVSTIWPSIGVGVAGMVASLQNETIYRDKLTGLHNRAYLDYISGELKRRKKRDIRYTAMMLDLNGFKSINDTYGHSAGDEALRAAAHILHEAVGTLGTVIRYAGDEFVVLLNTQQPEEVSGTIAAIHKGFADFSEQGGKPWKLSVSLGSGSFDLRQQSMDEVLNLIDHRMLEDKRAYYSRSLADRRRGDDSRRYYMSIFSIFRRVAEDYILLIDVDLETEKELQFPMHNGEDALSLPNWTNGGDDYTECITAYANLLIVPEDRPRFLEATRLNRLKAVLSVQKEFVIEYDVMLEDARRRFQGRFTTAAPERGGQMDENAKPHMYIGIRDITETVKNEARSRELAEYDRLHEADIEDAADRRTVLVMEDNDLERAMLRELLENDYRVLEAADGQSGLDLLEQQYRSVSLVLMNLSMPVLDGFDVLMCLQADALLSNIPVVAISENDDDAEEARSLALGASAYISKPYRPQRLLSRVSNIIKLKESSATLAAVEFDDLTGLYTRQAFYHHIENRLWQDPDSNYCLLVSDFEDFKGFNSMYGSRAGNQLLAAMGDFLRNYDNRGVLVGRIDSDRFAGLVRTAGECVSEEALNAAIDAVSERLPRKDITLKFGVYDHVDHTVEGAVLCDRALIALDSVKHHYGSPIGFYNAELRSREERNYRLEAEMQNAPENGQFKVYFQPKHDSRNGRLIGAEALLRWVHPELGFLSPGEFIPLFESTGFITRADEFVWQRVCEVLRAWMDAGIKPVPISVNASRADFSRADLFQNLSGHAADASIPPQLLHVEVTESLFTDNIETIIAMLTRFREYGIQVELDDFGSGYSSLNALSELPIDVVKLDMSFIRQIDRPQRQKVLAACIDLAHSMGLQTTAEGVETEEQLMRVRDLGADAIQGYYYSRPLPEAEFTEYLKRHTKA